ncbi:MAG: hypothetical protein L6Q54_13815 [Leptospiraceae bacterium]|nr:PD40 domain-containing protein [Leptospiraceae bacterium]MCK6382311.1 hypothetical protein [Leptospiraceae bacterium]NUM42297.1 PD40 domain-containing protein [Leptospiraceae bacterium]
MNKTTLVSKKISNKTIIFMYLIIFIIIFHINTCKSTDDRNKFSLSDFEIEELEKSIIYQNENGDYFYEDFQKLIEVLRTKGVSDSEIEKVIQKIYFSRSIKSTKDLKRKSESSKSITKKNPNTESSTNPLYKEKDIFASKENSVSKKETLLNNQSSAIPKESKHKSDNLTKSDEKQNSVIKDDSKLSTAPVQKNKVYDKQDAIILENTSGKDIIIQNPPAETFQFEIKKGGRIASFHTINGPEKDYHLVQNPAPNSSIYYFISDRLNPTIEKKFNEKELSEEILENEFGKEDYLKMKELIKSSSNISNNTKGKGYLEILICNSIWNKDKTKEIFINPRFLNLKDQIIGDKLGFSIFYNSKDNQVEMIFSAEGDLHRAISKDGETFEYKEALSTLNTQFIERDPSVSSDGKTIVFVSSRLFKSSLAGGSILIAFRNNVSDPFSEPIEIPGTADSTGEIFPCYYSNKQGDFIFFKKVDGVKGESKTGWLYSIQLQNKKLLPIVPFLPNSDIPFKYMVVFYNEKRGHRIMSSFPINNYDIFRMHLSEPVKVIVSEDGKILKK